MINGSGEQKIETAHDQDGKRNGQRQGARGIAGFAPGLGNGIEPDKAGEQERGSGKKHPPVERVGCLAWRDSAFFFHQLQRKIGVVMRKAGDNDNGTQGKHQQHEWNQGALVRLCPADINVDEQPDQG